MMKYQRVLYTNKFTPELKSKLRILSYSKRRSLKGNVYYVSFTSDADIKYAERASKQLYNVTLKPFQPRCCTKTEGKHQFTKCNHEKNLASSSIPSPSSSSSSSLVSFRSPPTTLTFLAADNSSFITSQSDCLRRTNETVEERVVRILGPCVDINGSTTLLPVVQQSNFEEKKQLIDNVTSCLSAMKMAQGAAEELYQLHKRGLDYRAALKHLIKVHATAFYLKAVTSAQIEDILSTDLQLSWPDIANDINAFRTSIGHEQSFIVGMASTKHILSKIDSTSSIAMSSKLAYQLTKLSH